MTLRQGGLLVSELVYRNLARYRYQVIEPCSLPFASTNTVLALKGLKAEHPFFTIDSNGVRAAEGYAWDGATGVAWQSQNLVVPSLVHDIGCQAVNLKLLPQQLRAVFDYEYRQQALKFGVSPLRAELHYAATSIWGRFPKEEELAPYAQRVVIDLRTGQVSYHNYH